MVNICTVKLWVSAMHIYYNAHSSVMFDNSVCVGTEFFCTKVSHGIVKLDMPYGNICATFV